MSVRDDVVASVVQAISLPGAEGTVLHPYVDQKEIPTFGIGINLLSPNGLNLYKIDKDGLANMLLENGVERSQLFASDGRGYSANFSKFVDTVNFRVSELNANGLDLNKRSGGYSSMVDPVFSNGQSTLGDPRSFGITSTIEGVT